MLSSGRSQEKLMRAIAKGNKAKQKRQRDAEEAEHENEHRKANGIPPPPSRPPRKRAKKEHQPSNNRSKRCVIALPSDGAPIYKRGGKNGKDAHLPLRI